LAPGSFGANLQPSRLLKKSARHTGARAKARDPGIQKRAKPNAFLDSGSPLRGVRNERGGFFSTLLEKISADQTYGFPSSKSFRHSVTLLPMAS
jgi:hypothetical protein